MGSEHYNNAFTRMLFKRVMKSPAMTERLQLMMNREVRPQDMIPPRKILRWILAETMSGNFAPWSSLPRTMRFGRTIERQQAVLDHALARAERGDLDPSVPLLPQ